MPPSELPKNFPKLPKEVAVKSTSQLPDFPHRGKEVGREDGRARSTRTTQKFQPSTCRHCHHITLHGITAEGLSTHLDPTPLNTHTEAQSLIADRATWHMTRNMETCWRSSTKITWWPAGNHPNYAVFAEHQCGNPIPATISSWAWGPHAPAPTSEEPEF